MIPLPYEEAVKHVRKEILSASLMTPLRVLQLCVYPEGIEAGFHVLGVRASAILTLSGRIVFQEDGGEELLCVPGSVLTIPGGRAFRWRVEEEASLLQCIHDGFNLEEHGLLATLFGALKEKLSTVDAGVKTAAEAERRLAAAKFAMARDVALSLTALDFMGAALEASQTNAEKPERSDANPALARCVSFIERNLDKEPSLQMLAEAARIGESRLSQLFRERLGMSPLRYFAKRRAENASRLLAEGGLSVGETAEKLGFSSLSHFSRFIKKQTGRAPSEIIASR